MGSVRIQNLTHPLLQPISANRCDSFWSRFRGLMLHSPLEPYEGALLVEEKENRYDSAIHMFFMNFDLAVIWINSKKEVVDVKLARKWQAAIIPSQPAVYVLETHVNRLTDFHTGDLVEIENA